jgi:ligand-binding SRPBCC domain-containing protein
LRHLPVNLYLYSAFAKHLNMKTHKFIKQSEIEAPPEEVFAFHENPEVLMKLTPPWEHLEIIEFAGSIKVGTKTIIKTFVGPFSRIWEAEHTEYIPNRLFADIQRRGPFAYWYHKHRFEPTVRGTTMMIDEIEYALPLGWFGSLLAGAFVRAKLNKMFDYRHKVLKEQLTPEASGKLQRNLEQ